MSLSSNRVRSSLFRISGPTPILKTLSANRPLSLWASWQNHSLRSGSRYKWRYKLTWYSRGRDDLFTKHRYTKEIPDHRYNLSCHARIGAALGIQYHWKLKHRNARQRTLATLCQKRTISNVIPNNKINDYDKITINQLNGLNIILSCCSRCLHRRQSG